MAWSTPLLPGLVLCPPPDAHPMRHTHRVHHLEHDLRPVLASTTSAHLGAVRVAFVAAERFARATASGRPVVDLGSHGVVWLAPASVDRGNYRKFCTLQTAPSGALAKPHATRS